MTSAGELGVSHVAYHLRDLPSVISIEQSRVISIEQLVYYYSNHSKICDSVFSVNEVVKIAGVQSRGDKQAMPSRYCLAFLHIFFTPDAIIHRKESLCVSATGPSAVQ